MAMDPPFVGGAWFHGWLTMATFNLYPNAVIRL
jgi:hypothetical protein